MVVVFGTVCLDRVRRVSKLPPIGGYVEVDSEALFLGGEAANTASHLHSWGHEVVLLGNGLGSDSDAALLRHLVRKAGLDDQHLSNRGQAPICDIFVTPDGERTMIGKGFAAMDEFVDPQTLPYQPHHWFTAESNMARASREAIKIAYEHGMHIYMMDFVRDHEFIPRGSIWHTSTDWYGVRGDAEANLKAVAAWSDRYDCVAILTDGANGLYFADAGQAEHRAPVRSVEVVDSTGAGDAFRAGVLAALQLGETLDAAIEIGQITGAEACLHLGAAAGLLSYPER